MAITEAARKKRVVTNPELTGTGGESSFGRLGRGGGRPMVPGGSLFRESTGQSQGKV